MSQSVIGALRVNLGLDSAQFQKGAKGAQQSLATMRKQFLAVSGAAAALGAAIGGFALKAAQDIDKVAKSARRIDATVAGYRALEMAADDAGANISSLADDIQTMNREIAKNSKGAQEALQSLGITAAQLGSLDADQKIALIADRVKALGLDSGQTSVILQQLGIRNREMALLVLGGGDALRRARVDVEEYGLALSDIDAAKIEAANDEIAGLADIGAYLGDQLALKVVPALGNMAMALTDSLREGGLLREAIDGLVGSIERLATYVGVAVTAFGVRYVAAFAAAKLATLTLAGALVTLKDALVRTGIGVAIVAVGEFVYWMGKAISAAGDLRDGLSRIFAVGQAVFLGVGQTAWGLFEILGGVANAIAGSFVAAFALIGKRWDSLVNGMSDAWNAIAQSGLGEALGLGTLGRSNVGGTIQGFADSLTDTAVEMIYRGGDRIKAAGAAVAESVKASVKPIEDANGELGGLVNASDTAADAAARLGDALDQVGDSAETTAEDTDAAADAANRFGGALDKVGSSAVRAADKTKELTDAQQALKQSADQVESNFESAFTSFVTGAKSAKQAVGELLSNLGRMAVSAAFKGLFGGSSFFQGLGALFAPSFDGGGYTGSGPRSGGIDGRGGFMAMLHPRETVIDHTRLGGGLAGAAGGAVRIMVEAVEGAMFAPRVRAEAQGVAVQVVQSYDRKLPDRVAGIQSDPRARG